MKINRKDLGWLTTVPSDDINFRQHLKEANWITLHEALKSKNLSKAACKFISAEIRRKEK